MHPTAEFTEEHALPCVEAVLAGTLALMTGYSQALQADQPPQHRLLMGVKIVRNLELLVGQPALTDAFRTVMRGLRQRWELMGACTGLPLPACGACAADSADSESAVFALTLPAPARVQ